MLSHEDERRLAAIERQLLIDDPAFARRLGRPVHRRTTWQRAVAALVAILCALATIVGILSNAGWLAFSSAVLTVAAVWVFHRARPARRGRCL